MNTVYGKIRPIKDRILVRNIEKGMGKTKGGIIIPSSDNASDGERGIRARWAQVYAVGPDVTDFKTGDWILIDHGRWTQGIQMQDKDGETFDLRLVDNKDILGISDEKPTTDYL